jgi:two-component system CheB/CheR fusion protein
MPRAREPEHSSSSTGGLTIAGVGASAGGLEAFTSLLDNLPPNPGIAIVFVQHLAPQHESALVPLLAGHTELPVIQATQDVKVQPNKVYVIPPNRRMALAGTTLHLSARPDDRSQYTPIDTFFSSLAAAAGPRSVGIILSGTASDGALGVREIKAAGGITIAQTPSTAKYDSMPRASMATGMIDLVLSPPQIGAKLTELARHAYLKPAQNVASDLPVSEENLQTVFDLLRSVSGIDFRHYKLPTIKRRLFRRMALHRVTDVAYYIRMLQAEPAEVRMLYQDLLIHVTRFFREPESFEALASDVFPAIVKERKRDQPIRAWVPGCATGEEAYSLAIALVEFRQKLQIDIPVQIFATDVSETAIEQARSGVFSFGIEGDVGADRLRRFFSTQDGGYRVSKAIRDLCVFARQDLTKDPPFSRLDLIVCRNVLIYMDAVLQKKLISIFHYALNPNGFLMLGQAESVGAQAALFSVVDKKSRVHRKKPTAASAMNFPVDSRRGAPEKRPAEPPPPDKSLQTEVSRVLMDRYAPPGVVVDSDLEIVQFRGQTSAYLEPAPGEASLNLLKMAKEGMLYGLRAAVSAARKTHDSVHRGGLQVRSGDGWKPVSIDVIPLGAAERQHYLVLFDDGQTGTPARSAGSSGRSKTKKLKDKKEKRNESRTQTKLLQRELAASREYLQSIIQEVEAANEELQSANEEILSSNEELQSTNEELDTAKEELQSTNEEINTVNEELHARNEELSRVNSDLINLLASVQIAIVIVSADLRIRRFTPMAEKVLNLIAADTDRLITHINPNIVGAHLEDLIAECLDTIAPVEREVQDRQGRWYSLRIRPYRTVDNKIEGAVLALFDIDAPKRYEEAVRTAVTLAEDLLRSPDEPVALVDGSLQLRAASARFAEIFALPGRDRSRGGSLADFVRDDDGLARLRQLAKGEQATPVGTVTALHPSNTPDAVTVGVRALAAFEGAGSRVVVLRAEEVHAAARTV